jgi:transcriptional regulator with XRE-family HTH domain
MGKTQADVVRATGLSYALITGFFNGYRNLSLLSLSKVNAFLGITGGDTNITADEPPPVVAPRPPKPREPKPKEPPPAWKTDYSVYLAEETAAYEALQADAAWQSQQQELNPGLDIPRTLKKAHVNFWGTEAGWAHKKKQRGRTSSWKMTFQNALTLGANKVWLPRESQYPKEEAEDKNARWIKAAEERRRAQEGRKLEGDGAENHKPEGWE